MVRRGRWKIDNSRSHRHSHSRTQLLKVLLHCTGCMLLMWNVIDVVMAEKAQQELEDAARILLVCILEIFLRSTFWLCCNVWTKNILLMWSLQSCDWCCSLPSASCHCNCKQLVNCGQAEKYWEWKFTMFVTKLWMSLFLYLKGRCFLRETHDSALPCTKFWLL